MSESLVPLSEAEDATLQSCEERIATAEPAVADWSAAFRTIHDQRLYRDEFKTFAEYVRIKWGKSLRSIYETFQIEDVKENVRNSAHDQDPETVELANTSSANALLELSKVKPDKQADTLKAAAKRSKRGKPTANDIKETVANENHRKAPKEEPRSFGCFSNKPVDTSIYAPDAKEQPPALPAHTAPRSGTPQEALPPVTDPQTAQARLLACYETHKPWFNSLPPRSPRDILDRLVKALFPENDPAI